MQIHSIVLLVLVIAGCVVFRFGMKLAAEKDPNQRDALGVRYSERALFLMGNGIVLLFVGIIGIVLKLVS